jgi:nucleotide-binding universal stress UspA family protein
MIERILVPLDGSPRAEQALSLAQELAQRLDVELHLVRATTSAAESLRETVPSGRMGGPDTLDDIAIGVAEDRVEREAAMALLYLESVKQRLQGAGLRVVTEVRTGNAAPVIMEYAREIGASLIVMSTHGRSGIGRAIYGSVADAVLRESGTPVLLVRVQA